MTSSKQYLRSQHGGLGAVKRAGYRRAMALEPWATVQAARLIAPLGDRWTHVQAVADKARGVATVLPDEDADLLVAAAPVHDVGYAPSLDRLGFGSGAGQELHPQGRRAVPHRDRENDKLRGTWTDPTLGRVQLADWYALWRRATVELHPGPLRPPVSGRRLGAPGPSGRAACPHPDTPARAP